MKGISIVDSHVHFWNPAELRYTWLDGLPALNRAFLPTEFAEADKVSNVIKLIFVEAGCESTQSQAEVDWVCGLAKNEPRLKGIVAHAPLEKGENARAELDALASRPLVKGVRRSLQGESDAEFCLRPNFLVGTKLLADFGFTFDLCVRHDQLRQAAELVQHIPQVTFVLDHFGKPDVRGKNPHQWATDLKALAAVPNVVCKISGLTTEADWSNWKPTDLEIYFQRTLELFGFDRVLFGGDWPVATQATSYEHWIETVHEMVSFASEADRLKLFQTNAERIYCV
jgi:L-fuconolactonase